VNYNHFQSLVNGLLTSIATDQQARNQPELIPAQLPALTLAYIGDAFFTLYVRTRLLTHAYYKVRVLHTLDAQMVSAKYQAVALRELEPDLTEPELAIVRRGRNTKSRPTKSATVGDYRHSTAFEALLGYLFLTNSPRLYAIADKAFVIISRKLVQNTAEDL